MNDRTQSSAVNTWGRASDTWNRVEDIAHDLRAMRAEVAAERRRLAESGDYTDSGLTRALDSSDRLQGRTAAIDKAEQRMAELVAKRATAVEAERAKAVPRPTDQTAAELRFARKRHVYDHVLSETGATGLPDLIAATPDEDVALLLEYVEDSARAGHKQAQLFGGAVEQGLAARNPNIAAAQAAHRDADASRSVLAMQIKATRTMLENGGVSTAETRVADNTLSTKTLASSASSDWKDVELD